MDLTATQCVLASFERRNRLNSKVGHSHYVQRDNLPSSRALRFVLGAALDFTLENHACESLRRGHRCTVERFVRYEVTISDDFDSRVIQQLETIQVECNTT